MSAPAPKRQQDCPVEYRDDYNAQHAGQRSMRGGFPWIVVVIILAVAAMAAGLWVVIGRA